MIIKSLFSTVFILFFIVNIKLYSKEIYYYANNSESFHSSKKNSQKSFQYRINSKMGYENKVLLMALEKTVPTYGDYELSPSPTMNKKRAIYNTRSNKIKNLILIASPSQEMLNDTELVFSIFPVNRGINGYRIALISPKIKDDESKYDTLEKIKKLKTAQGKGWVDSKILKYNGFNVKEYSNHKGLFDMVSLGRVDLFLRGVNEIKFELEKYSENKNLIYDKTFLIQYPLPKFYFTHKSNKKALERIDEGLKLAYADGSLDLLFEKNYEGKVNFNILKNRKIYKLENPFLNGIDKSYEKYNIKILGE